MTPALHDDAIFVPSGAEAAYPADVVRLVELARNVIAEAMRHIQAHALDAVIVISNEGSNGVAVRVVERVTLLDTPGGNPVARVQLAKPAPARLYHCIVIPVAADDGGICVMLSGEPMVKGGDA